MTRPARVRPTRTRRPRLTTLAQLMTKAVEANPAGTAVRCADATDILGELTYAELDERSTRLARALIARGIGPEDLVALGIPRSVESVLACWAVAKTGAGFVPVDPNYPADRVAHMLSDSGAVVGITVADVRAELPGDVEWLVLDDPATDALVAGQSVEPVTNDDRVRHIRAEHPAYVIYTSGSTGMPKGVVVTQAGLASFCEEQRERYRVTESSRTLHFASPSFDASVLELLLAIGGAATMIVVAPTVYGGAELAGLLRRNDVTHAFITPAALASIDPTGLDALRVVVAGGEAVPPELVRRWAIPLADGSIREFYNGYGPTETTIMTNISDPLTAGELVTIGAPIRNVTAYVLDSRLRLVPTGVTGELYLAGAQLARGYGNRPGLSADRFVANPFADNGARMYRTGDLVRRTATGELEYLGRNDFQVKIRGFRIELGEIDAVLAAHERVDFAVTVGHQLDNGSTILAAYVHPADGAAVDAAELTTELVALAEQHLPAHMVPTSITVLDEIPLTPVGKLDRRALPAPALHTKEFRAPVGRFEEMVAQVFDDLVGDGSPIGAADDFFELGGNSLIATQAAARLGALLDTKVPTRLLFEASSVAKLAERIAELSGQGGREELRAGPRPERIPLSLAQQRMWFLNRFDSASAAYTIPIAIRLSGALDVAALTAAFDDLIARHEVLRTVYPETADGPVQVILAPGEELPRLELREVTPEQVRAAVGELLADGFDVTTEVPLRAVLFRVAEQEFVLAIAVHHIAGDGSSGGPLTRDLMTAYVARAAGHAPEWPPLPVQYADYSVWQRRMLGSDDDPDSLAAAQIGYWKRQLADLPDQLDLPADRPRPAVQSFDGGVVDIRIDAELHRALADLARAEGATLFMVVHAALAVLLSRLSGAEDIAIGTPIAGRGEAALDDLIGMFVNTLVFRSRIDRGESFTALLGRQRETDLQAFAHADVPFERLVEVLNPVRSTARHPLFQVGFSFQNLAQASLELPGLTVAGLDVDTHVSQFDLHWIIGDSYDADGAPAGLGGALTFATALFERRTVEMFVDRFVRLLREVTAAPRTPVGDIDLLDPAERERILVRANTTGYPLRPGTLAELLDSSVAAASSHAVALVSDDGSRVSWSELDARVNRLARQLIARGVGPETRVALAMRRGVNLVVAMYAVTRAGGAYVPVDPDQAADRTGYILLTAAPILVLTDEATDFVSGNAAVLRVDGPALTAGSADPITDADRIAPLRPDNTAYVIFTSGSTGRPKGVAVPHAAVVNQLRWKAAEFGLAADDAVLLKTAATFDLSVWEFWSAAVCAGRLVIASPDGHRDPAYLNHLMEREGVTTLHVVPSMLDALLTVSDGRLPGALRRILAIGEALPATTAQRTLAAGAALFNLYGPTEAAVSITNHPVTEADRASVPIGAPEWNSRVYVLDARLRPVPVGVPGELYLAGDQLARGYFGRPDLTSDRFVANPFEPGARMYRTGDLVAWTAAGELDYRGRTDFQVKVRGFRIELGEIEAALLDRPGVAAAAVAAKSDPHTGDLLVGYLVPAEAGAELDIPAITAALAARLPSYMTPTAWVVLPVLPLNVNGKLDRKALPDPVFEAREFRAPGNPIEEIVAGVFVDVLGVERVGVDDDFFALGGNSLIATQVAARLGAALDAEVPVRLLFEASTVAALAVRVETLAGAGRRPALSPRPRPDRIPLSLAQQRMWLLNGMGASTAVYNIPAAVRLSGELSVSALREALADVLARHEVLRTVYPAHEGTAHQVVLPADQVAPELTAQAVPASEVPERIVRAVTTGFDVTAEVPVRVELFRIAEEPSEYVLVLVVHHISADGWSMAPFTRDLMIAYAARTAGSPPAWQPLPVQYADYSLWQRELLGDENDPQSVAARQLGYWRTALAGLPDALDLPFDRPRPALQDTVARSVVLNIDAPTHRALLAVARERNATLFMAVHTALAVLLARWSRSDDIAIGSPTAGRGDAALDDLIGMFVNTLVLRTRVNTAESFGELLSRQRETDLAAFAHADVPFEHLVDVLNPVRSTARHPVFQIMLAFQNQARAGLELPGLSVSAMEFDAEQTEYDLQLMLGDGYDEHGEPTGIAGRILFPVSLFDESTIQTLARRFERLLAALAAEPAVPVGDVEWLTETERAEVLAVRNATDYPLDAAATLVSLSALGSRIDPRAVAIVDGALTDERTEISYADWDARVHRLARHLISLGVGPETRVVVALHRSVDLLVAVHAVLRAGGTYVPVDPDHPEDRTAYVLELSEPSCVLTHAAADFRTDRAPVIRIDELDLSGYRDEPITDVERLAPLRPANTAYILFTSGSTGRPKGVAVPHRAVANHVRWFVADYGIGAADISLFKTTITFDMSIWDVFVPFITGGRVVVASRDGHRDPRYLAEVIEAERVSVTPFVPSMLRAILDTAAVDSAALHSLRVIWLAGEALPAETAAAARRVSRARLDNLYGPTETAVVTMTARVPEDAIGIVPIGTPIWNVRAYVLDDRLHPVPVGVAGELYHAGIQLSHGYFGRPDLTASRYVASPFAPGERLYRTGDLVRWNTDGHMEYLGRTDFQVKIRGLRIELGEIETALAAHEGVRRAVVIVHTDEQLGDQLVGYVLPEAAAGEVDTESFKAHLAERVPSYMVPATFVVLDELPLNANGKLDRRQLPRPAFVARSRREPRTPLEHSVTGVFAEVLGLDAVGMDDSFFELGGNSLVATRAAARLGEELGIRVPVVWMFTAPTPAGLAAQVLAQQSGADAGPVSVESAFDVLVPLRVGTGAPLFCIHPFGGIAWSFAGLAAHVGGDRPIFGLQSPALGSDETLPESTEKWALRYLEEIRAVQPRGPYHLLGWSLGGVLAHAIAVQLQAEGERVELLAMMDSYLRVQIEESAIASGPVPMSELLGGLLGDAAQFDLDEIGDAAEFGPAEIAERLAGLPEPFASFGAERIARVLEGAVHSAAVTALYRPRPFDGDLVYFTAAEDDPSGRMGADTWIGAVQGTIRNHQVPTSHWRMTAEAGLAEIGRVLDAVHGSGQSGTPRA
ncbi:amino acid adenylation domain-containing protein [Nocardia higoensis]|uniref:Amino acid adenylation domain-containing protein n=1 Tax=Nocardia higoensis TaxID=228599 RepID=A0ABS0DC74_9NOCA|nr:non-ribosomal peptide synthetase [Nocardia higoensis]MBF6356082.1 amino acid adenylation domain-containing protein [Nocardia higoensis]